MAVVPGAAGQEKVKIVMPAKRHVIVSIDQLEPSEAHTITSGIAQVLQTPTLNPILPAARINPNRWNRISR